MGAMVLFVAAVGLGIDTGWQPLPEGGLEYIIQIEPPMLESLKAGEEVASDIPPDLRGIRSYRIKVGTGELPRKAAPEPAADRGQSPLEPPPTQSTPGQGPVPFLPPRASVSDASASSQPPKFADNQFSSVSENVPQTLKPDPYSKPLSEQQAGFIDQIDQHGTVPTPHAKQAGVESPSDRKPGKPWLPFTLALAGLFGSVGGMLYFGCIAWDYRRRYRTLLQRLLDAEGIPLPAGDAPDSPNGSPPRR